MWREKKGAIFDMDGTLMDSLGIWRDIDIAYLGRFGIEMPDGFQADLGGKSMHELAVYIRDRFGLPDSPEKMMADWNEMAFEFYRTEAKLKPGALDLLNSMKERGMKVGIATSNSHELTKEALRANGIEEMFDTVRTSREVPNGKPAPDIYLSVAREWGIDPSDIIVFEDIPDGILSGRSAGMEVIGVDDLYAHQTGQAERVRELADRVITDFTELLQDI